MVHACVVCYHSFPEIHKLTVEETVYEITRNFLQGHLVTLSQGRLSTLTAE